MQATTTGTAAMRVQVNRFGSAKARADDVGVVVVVMRLESILRGYGATAVCALEVTSPCAQPERLAALREKSLAAGIAFRPLGDADQRHAAHAERRQGLARCAELALTAVDKDQVRPGGVCRLLVVGVRRDGSQELRSPL